MSRCCGMAAGRRDGACPDVRCPRLKAQCCAEFTTLEKGVKMENKKAYEAPAVIYRQVLEAVAGACEASDPTNGKTTGTCTTANS